MKILCASLIFALMLTTPGSAEELGDPHTSGAWSKYEPPVMGGFYESSSQPNWNSPHSTNYLDTSGRSCNSFSSGQGYTSFQCN